MNALQGIFLPIFEHHVETHKLHFTQLKYYIQTQHFNIWHKLLHVSVQQIIIRHYFTKMKQTNTHSSCIFSILNVC